MLKLFSFNIRTDQLKELKRRAAQEGVSVAFLIRTAIKHYLNHK